MLEEYWEKNKVREEHTAEDAGGDSPVLKSRSRSSPQPNGYRRPRAISDVTALITSDQTLSPHHPAISLPRLISDFGPLIFPLYRAALLRKRILMVADPPVERNCNIGTVNQSPSVVCARSLIGHSLRSVYTLFCPSISPPTSPS